MTSIGFEGVADPLLIRAWLVARSLSRGLPTPVDDHGGWRVDTAMPAETCRYVFAEVGDGLRQLAQSIAQPGILLKLCGSEEELRSLVPWQWRVRRTGRVMHADHLDAMRAGLLPKGYTLEMEARGPVTAARIRSGDGAIAASGYGAETEGIFAFDRIATDEAHRRLGLGRAIMLALGQSRRDPRSIPILVATDVGRALYATLGWRDGAAYVTADIPETPQESGK